MIYQLEDRHPTIDADCYIAPNATVIGSVIIEKGVSIWFNTVLRADNDEIMIGEGSNVQDGAVLHTDPGLRLVIGKNVTIGHKAVIHGCTIGDHTLVGINAVILNRAKIGKHCVIGANALVTEGKEIPDYSVVMGSPGRVVKTISHEESLMMNMAALSYVKNGERYRNFLIKES